MAGEIAVFCNADGLSAVLGEAGKIIVFRRSSGVWEVVREKDCFLDARAGLRQMRQQIKDILGFLESCRIFVAAQVTGVPYYELEKAGFSVWEYSGDPIHYLENIWLQEEQDTVAVDQESPSVRTVLVSPIEKKPGYFTVSLKEIQQKNAGVTSKQVLLPFINRRQFQILEIECTHLPPWLELLLNNELYSYTSERISPNELVVKINNLSFLE
ncbi:MAG: anfO [Firmicutes bacterium]|nr:anfO [Bacillota bacterium]